MPTKTKHPPKKIIKKILRFYISLYIRLRDTNRRWYGKCISCPVIKYRRHNWQIKEWLEPWHFIANAISKFLTYNEDNLNGQCYQCNDMKHWNYPRYEDWLIAKIWIEKVQYLKTSKSILKSWKERELLDLLVYFQSKVDQEIQKKDQDIQQDIIAYIGRNVPKKRQNYNNTLIQDY